MYIIVFYVVVLQVEHECMYIWMLRNQRWWDWLPEARPLLSTCSKHSTTTSWWLRSSTRSTFSATCCSLHWSASSSATASGLSPTPVAAIWSSGRFRWDALESFCHSQSQNRIVYQLLYRRGLHQSLKNINCDSGKSFVTQLKRHPSKNCFSSIVVYFQTKCKEITQCLVDLIIK